MIYIDEQNKTGSAEINFHIYGPLIFDKVTRQFKEEKTVSSRNGARTTIYPHAKV